MKQGWEIKRLGDICDLQNGFAFKSKDYIDSSKTMNFRMSQIKPGGGIDLENNPKYLPDEYIVKYKDYLLKEGDVVIAMTDLATETKILGVPAIVPKDTRNWLLNQRVGKLFKIDFTKVDGAFLKYILTSEPINEYYKSLGRGGLQINIGKQDILNAKFPLPPLPEQQRIVAILDEAFAAIAKAKANSEQNLKNAKELFESYLQSVFDPSTRSGQEGEGWEEKTIAQISKTFGRGKSKYRPRNWAGLYGGNYPFIQTGDIRNCNHFITEYTQTYNEVGLAQSKLWKAGTICITIAANIAETGVLTFDACFPDSVIGIEVNENVADRDFVEYLLQSFKVRIQALSKGSAQANINMATFENELFPFPPVKEQQAIVQKLDALSAQTQKLEAIYQQQLNDLDELKKSVLQKAFNGELNTENPEGMP